MTRLVPDDSLLRITLAKETFDEQYESFFIQDKFSYLEICLHLMDPHFLTKFCLFRINSYWEAALTNTWAYSP